MILAAVRTAQVIIRDTELTDTKIIQLLELSDQGIIIIICVVIESISRMHAPAEAHVVFLAFLGQLTQLFSFIIRIQLTPLILVIWVIFRRIDICIHLEFAGFAHQREAVLKVPWITVESFDKSTQLDIRIIRDHGFSKCAVFFSLFHHLGQRHDAVVSAVFVCTDDVDLTFGVLIVAGAQDVSLFFLQHGGVCVCRRSAIVTM